MALSFILQLCRKTETVVLKVEHWYNQGFLNYKNKNNHKVSTR